MSLHPIARLLLLFLSYLLAVMRGDRFSSATRLANSLAMLPAEKRGVKVRLRCMTAHFALDHAASCRKDS